MLVLIFFAFLSGLLTIFAPCIWPLLPIVLSSSATGGKSKPLGVTLGIMASFALITLGISYLVKIIPFDPNILRYIAVIVLTLLGLTLVIPALSSYLEGMVSRFAGGAASKNRDGFVGGLLTGFSLGVVWSPCAGPILATIATIAATRTVNVGIIIVTLVYVIGIGIPLFLFAWAGNKLFTQSRVLSRYTGRVQQIFGFIIILSALAIATNYDKIIEAKLLDAIPAYSNILYKIEGLPKIKQELNALKNQKGENIFQQVTNPSLPKLGAAPEFTGITKWLNTESPLTMKELRGKVVLIDFWTYTCINCIRTLPHVTEWYEKYKDKGFVVVGVHTPEFEFEKKTENVQNAISQYNIHYPVAQDNDYGTWNAYTNQYWPAEYLVDAQGIVRRTHFGEGEYDETEKSIQLLLKEAGSEVGQPLSQVTDTTPHMRLTPETYLGLKRMERFISPENPKGGTQQFSLSDPVTDHYWGVRGTWDFQPEYAQAGGGSQLDLGFYADKVFLVITPKTNNDTVRVYLDGRMIGQESAGDDVKNGVVRLDGSRLYHLIDLHGKPGSHILRLEFGGGSQLFAFTFG